MMAEQEVDLFVIGGGSGGVRAARIAAGHGAKVMLAEEYRLGGTCVIRGCVPKKLLAYAARFADDFEDAAGFGWTVPTPSFDWPTLIANKDKEIARLEAAYASTLDHAGVAIAKTRAVFDDAHTVRLGDGTKVRARYVLIATGGSPHHGDPIPGIERVISSNEAFHLPELPRRILIQGGGYVAIEFAGIFAGLGSEVTIVYRGENILRGFDDDVRQHLRDELERRGIKIMTHRLVHGIEHTPGGDRVELSDGGIVEVDRVMFAIGRSPNIAGLGLRRIGCRVDEDDMIVVDKFSKTSVPHIFAVGDCTNRLNLTPVAIREGHAFADSVFGGKPTPVDHSNVATAVFSEPEVGAVGLTEAEACDRFAQVDIYRTTFRPMRATLSGRDTQILFKLVVDGTTDRVLGCHIVGPDAAEMIQLVAIALKMKATKADLDATMAVHPTAAEELVTMRQKTASYRRAAAE